MPSTAPLTALLLDEIARRGPIPFCDFMERALYHPGHGYYTSGRARIGRGGDFFTNVSVGPLFGGLLARQLIEMWERLDRPSPFALVEQGAHSGELAHDILTSLEDLAGDCAAAAVYHIVEPAPALRHSQAARLAGFSPRIHWHDSLADLPAFTGVHLSNELIDAFPVHLVKWTGHEWVERHVTISGGLFAFTDGPLSTPSLSLALTALPPVAAGCETEINLAASQWIEALAPKLLRGYLLAIDYGFARDELHRPERTSGTLAAYAAHRREPDPLARPGEIDLTAHVDFTSLAEAALACGLHLHGFTDQHHFMVGLGRLHFPETAPDPKELRAFQTLMHPTLMGRAFQVLCLSRHLDPRPLAGFDFAKDPGETLGLRPSR